ncbi:MAG: hypothetical protein ABR530_01950 [Pyrinomonadaceae bacterium]
MPVSSEYTKPQIMGRTQTDEVKESSGLAVSRCQDNVLWTHNDAGSDAFIFALATDGRHLGTWRVENSQNVDWEDIDVFKDASGTCSLLIGDVGDNGTDRAELQIYRIPEPVVTPADAASSTKNPLKSAPAEVLRYRYADGRNNAETLLAHPLNGDLYVLTKNKKGPSSVYKIKPVFAPEVQASQKIGELIVPSDPPGLLTGGAISPDGRRVILCDVKNGYELILPDGADFDAIWQQRPLLVDLGDRKQGEGVTYTSDGRSIVASSEKKNAPLFRIDRR